MSSVSRLSAIAVPISDLFIEMNYTPFFAIMQAYFSRIIQYNEPLITQRIINRFSSQRLYKSREARNKLSGKGMESRTERF